MFTECISTSILNLLLLASSIQMASTCVARLPTTRTVWRSGLTGWLLACGHGPGRWRASCRARRCHLPLMTAVQAHYPGALWVAATTEWTGEMPNPLEVGAQLARCREMAADVGLDTDNVFLVAGRGGETT